VAEVAEMTKDATWPAEQWSNFACVYVIASGKNADRKQEYADRAIDTLRKAVKAGFKDVARTAKDMELDPLRGRGDFTKLIEELAKKSPAKPEPKP
jgi:eukaryotic-like serine/threonine-protein kinase